MDISIVVCCHNSSSKLPSLFHSLAKLNLSEIDVEWIFINNLSSDATGEIILRLSSMLSGKIIVEEENELGLMYARVHGIKLSSGNLVIFFDDDNYPAENYLIETIKIFDNNPALIALGGSCFPTTPNMPEWMSPIKGLLALRNIVKEDIFKFDLRKGGRLPWGAGMVIKGTNAREAINTIEHENLYDFGRKGTKLSSGDDTLLCCLAAKGSGLVGCSPNLVLYHDIDPQRYELEYLLFLANNIGISGLQVFYYIANKFDKTLIKNSQTINVKIKLMVNI